MPKLSMAFVALCIGSVVTASARRAFAAPPSLYTQPFHQSPVEGDPDDLLLLAGGGFTAGSTVVYRRLLDTTLPIPTPTEVPPTSTADQGVAPVVSETALPDNIVVRLPAVMLHGESYALWVRGSSSAVGEWSRPIKINDARPLWVTPASMPRRGSIPGLPRELKVVGRNLQHATGATTQVRLTSAGTAIVLPAADDGVSSTSIERYVARVELPAVLSPGEYRVEVTRDGRSWVEVTDQRLTVFEDASGPPRAVRIDDYGCSPSDGADDTSCFDKAFHALPAAGGVVFVPAGVWDLMTPPADDNAVNGLVVPANIHLQGEGPLLTRILRRNEWNENVLFTLLGRNRVSGIYFDDVYRLRDERAVHFQLGKRPSATSPTEPRVIEDIVFDANAFRGMNKAIGGGGLPVRRLYIVGNQFNAYQDSLFLDSYYLPREEGAPFDLQDSIVARNLFLPGDYVDLGIYQGAIATQIGAAQRVDFSENFADGRALPSDTKHLGWRAAFFFHQTNNHERLLISRNVASCTGDRAGDGEAVAFDHAVNKYAFDAPVRVVAAASDRVTVREALLDPVLNAYAQHWVQIVNGQGVGQSRRIRSYAPIGITEVEFAIEPPWEVVPNASSSIVVTRQYWQTYVVDNEIDIRGCAKNNPNWVKSGQITVWAQNSDSAVDGNTQYKSDGIHITAGHSIQEPPVVEPWEVPDVPRRVHFAYFLDVRRNRIIDEYDYGKSHWSLGGSFAGIQLVHWTLPKRAEAQVAYGISVAHNRVVQADGSDGGGIAIVKAWYGHPAPSTPVQTRSVLIHHNDVRDIQCVTYNCLFDPVRRIGIRIADRWAWDTTLYANQLTNCNEGVVDDGMRTTQVP